MLSLTFMPISLRDVNMGSIVNCVTFGIPLSCNVLFLATEPFAFLLYLKSSILSMILLNDELKASQFLVKKYFYYHGYASE